MEESNKNARRKFLDKGLKLGFATALSGIGITKIAQKLNASPNHDSHEKMELMDTEGNIIEVDSTEVMEITPKTNPEDKYNVREGIPNRKFVMVIDLAKCKNALACQSACNKHHYITGDNAWIKVYNMQESADTAPYWMPVTCQHCDEPACVTVCPVDATFKRRDGLVLIDNERCIGCKFCISACPYSARILNWTDRESYVNNDPNYSPESSLPAQHGVVSKCDFCADRSREGKLPYCASSCPMGAIYFGDKNEDAVTNGEETLRFKKLIRVK